MILSSNQNNPLINVPTFTLFKKIKYIICVDIVKMIYGNNLPLDIITKSNPFIIS